MKKLEEKKRSIIYLTLVKMCIHGFIIGVCAGSIIALFRLTHNVCRNTILDMLEGWQGYPWIIPIWFIFLFIISWIIGKIILYSPYIAGSGIPQIELMLARKLNLPWRKTLITKFIGSWLAQIGGLSLGQEGPCIQMGAMTGVGLGEKILKKQDNTHIIGGAAAGITAAFGAPIAGILLVFEEMKTSITLKSFLLVCFAVTGSQIVLQYGFGIKQLFDFQAAPSTTLKDFIFISLLGVIISLLGVFYNKLLLFFKDQEAKQTLLPESLRTLPPLFFAGIFSFFIPQITNGGALIINELPITPITYSLIMLIILKALFSTYSFTGNVPGGILMPILCIGALIGNFIGEIFILSDLLEPTKINSLIVYSMAAFFATTVRAPLTGTALTIEITGTLHCLPGVLYISLISHIIANIMHSLPIYDSLKQRVHIPNMY